MRSVAANDQKAVVRIVQGDGEPPVHCRMPDFLRLREQACLVSYFAGDVVRDLIRHCPGPDFS